MISIILMFAASGLVYSYSNSFRLGAAVYLGLGAIYLAVAELKINIKSSATIGREG